MAGARSLPLGTLRVECVRLRDHLISTGASSAEGMERIAPGGPDNPDTGPRGVMLWYGLLNQSLAADRVQQQRATAGEVRSAADATVMAALAARPEVVRLVTPLLDERRTLAVYPKSIEALAWLAAQDRWLGELTAKRAIIAKSQAEQDRRLVNRVDREIVYSLGLMTWCVTAEGPGVPFTVDEDPETPDWVQHMDPIDIHQVMGAHQTVNGRRLQAVGALITTDAGPGTKSPAWSVFLAAAAHEVGVQPAVLMRDWSLGEVLASFRLANQAKKDAHEAAKAKRPQQPVGAGRMS